jgi:hypothetical protein
VAKKQFPDEVIHPLLVLLDNRATLTALAEVLSVECRDEKEIASREALAQEPSLSAIVQHEAKAAAFGDVIAVIRRACGV